MGTSPSSCNTMTLPTQSTRVCKTLSCFRPLPTTALNAHVQKDRFLTLCLGPRGVEKSVGVLARIVVSSSTGVEIRSQRHFE